MKSRRVDHFRLELIFSGRRMTQIAKTMTRLERKSAWRRFWHKDKYEEALVEHAKSLEHALLIFQVCLPLLVASLAP